MWRCHYEVFIIGQRPPIDHQSRTDRPSFLMIRCCLSSRKVCRKSRIRKMRKFHQFLYRHFFTRRRRRRLCLVCLRRMLYASLLICCCWCTTSCSVRQNRGIDNYSLAIDWYLLYSADSYFHAVHTSTVAALHCTWAPQTQQLSFPTGEQLTVTRC